MIKAVLGTEEELNGLIAQLNDFGKLAMQSIGRTVTEQGVKCRKGGKDSERLITSICSVEQDEAHGFYIAHTDAFYRNKWRVEILEQLAVIIEASGLEVKQIELTAPEL